MRFISLTNSKYSAIVDDEDYDRAIKFEWNVHLSEKGIPDRIVASGMYNKNLSRGSCEYGARCLTLHRFVLNKHLVDMNHPIDHKFGDVFDNRKGFLRVCSPSQNTCNRTKSKNNTTGFIGVSYHPKKKSPYRADICKNGVKLQIGYFMTAIEAAKARDKKAIEIHGKFAMLNFSLERT